MAGQIRMKFFSYSVSEVLIAMPMIWGLIFVEKLYTCHLMGSRRNRYEPIKMHERGKEDPSRFSSPLVFISQIPIPWPIRHSVQGAIFLAYALYRVQSRLLTGGGGMVDTSLLQSRLPTFVNVGKYQPRELRSQPTQHSSQPTEFLIVSSWAF